jgi:predicted signal transduction protein with EAL and GGDEF domain
MRAPGRQVQFSKEVQMSQGKITEADLRSAPTAEELQVMATSASTSVAGELAARAAVARPWRRNQRGMVTAEWAVGIIAAAGLAGILIIVVTHGAVRDALLQFILHVVHFISGKI